MNRTACKGRTTACTDLDLRLVRFGVAEPIAMCAGCRATPFGLEAQVVERRVMRQPVVTERRWAPAWRRHTTGKDLTGALAS